MRDQLRIPLIAQFALTLQRSLQAVANRNVTQESRPPVDNFTDEPDELVNATMPRLPTVTHLFLLDTKIGR